MPSAEEFEESIGSADKLNPEDVRDGFWAASQILQANTSKASKRIILFTNTDNPFPKSTQDAK